MRLIFGFILFLNLIACANKEEKRSKLNHSLKEIKPLFKDEDAFENEIKSIETNNKLIEVSSLEYLSSEGDSYLVKGLVEVSKNKQNMTLRKLTFRKVSQNGNETICSYFYIGSRKFSSECEQLIQKGVEFIKVFTKSYYDDSSNVFFSKSSSGRADSFNKNEFSSCKPTNHDDNLALKIINQEGDFETNFQGFTESMGKNYLILGTESMSSTVAFLDYNPSLKLLKNNEKKYLGKKLIVSFSVKTEANGFTFQALEDIDFAK